MKTLDIIATVEELNTLIYDNLTEKEQDEYFFYLNYRTDGINEVVEFCDHPIWSSENDERCYVETEFGEEYEPLADFLKREVARISLSISRAGLAMYKNENDKVEETRGSETLQ